MLFTDFLLKLCEQTLKLISKLTGLILTFDVIQLDSKFKIRNSSGSIYLLRKLQGSTSLSNNFPIDLLNPYGNQIAIILQGPVSSNFRLTQQAISHYRNLFPDIHIIVSTWDGEKLDSLSRDSKTHYIQSNKPYNPGYGNINLQILSTKAGLNFAKLLGVEYIIKSRTDQILSSPTLLLTLKAKIEEGLSDHSISKIVVSSLNTFLFRPYSITDMFQFSTLENLYTFWDLSEQKKDVYLPTKKDSNVDWSTKELCEVYLTVNYLQKLGCEIDFTIPSYFKHIVDYFLVVDQEDISQIWPKYTLLANRRNVPYFPSRYTEMSANYFDMIKGDLNVFNDWIEIAQSREIL